MMYVYLSYSQDTFLFDDQSNILLDSEPGVIRLEGIATALDMDPQKIQSIALDANYFHFSQLNPYTELRARFASLNELMFVTSRLEVGPWTNYNFIDGGSRLWDMCTIGFYWPPEERKAQKNKGIKVHWIPLLCTWKMEIV